MNTHREKSTIAPPGKGVGKHENPVPGQTGIKSGRGWEMPSPPKGSNPAPSILGPSWILPLASGGKPSGGSIDYCWVVFVPGYGGPTDLRWLPAPEGALKRNG